MMLASHLAKANFRMSAALYRNLPPLFGFPDFAPLRTCLCKSGIANPSDHVEGGAAARIPLASFNVNHLSLTMAIHIVQ